MCKPPPPPPPITNYTVLRLFVFSRCNSCCCQIDFVDKYGKWAVVTGATDGIGQAMAIQLAQRGMSILVVARNENKLVKTKEMLEKIENVGQVETVKIDLSNSSIENFNKISTKINANNRDIGLLINNAGSIAKRCARFNRLEMDEIIEMVNVNVIAPLHMTRMIMPGMIQRNRGMVVNVSSIGGDITVPYLNVYGATKTFLSSFTRQLQTEYKSHSNIDIVLIKPGTVYTGPVKAFSKIDNPSYILTPTPEDYAKSCINSLSTGIKEHTGNLAHEFVSFLLEMFQKFGLLSTFIKLTLTKLANNNHVSPEPKRKKLAS